jgi:L,D-transpeptidase ErfK/SrfK
MGWDGNELYMEVHTPLEGSQEQDIHSLTQITRLLVTATQDRPSGVIDWAKAEQAFSRASGIPEAVMLGAPTTTSQLVGTP